MNKQYVTALEESLEKKIRVLDEIYRISRLQTEILDKKPMDFERFDAYVDDKDICIEKRGAGGVADELVIVGDEGTYKVISEHNIRYVLNNGESKIYRMDGSEVAGPNLLPSGFFVITTGKKEGNVVGYTLTGGGYGHGVGMSQNGAKEMAKCGFRAEDILLFFYEDCYIKSIYE